jgi:polyphenol oxidase
VGDAPAHVAENRRRLIEALGLPGQPRWLEQVHGTTVLDLDHYTPPPEDARAPPNADGAVTSRAGVVCAVLTADCLPVLFCDTEGGRIGVAHAGWRGLAAGVLQATVEAMGLTPDRLLAWLGPAIGAARFEVGPEVRAAFVERHGTDEGFEPNQRGRWQADLYSLARQSLGLAGVESVYGGGRCTFTEADRFFSHRREAPCGRMATLIWIEDATESGSPG